MQFPIAQSAEKERAVMKHRNDCLFVTGSYCGTALLGNVPTVMTSEKSLFRPMSKVPY
jgi:hypothetical protein